MVKLSVIIATYNRGEYILDTLNSLAAQSLQADIWELVVVNNNSVDNTMEVFDTFLSGHPDINARMVSETRQGLSYARNRGIDESVGEYIVVLDDDEEVNVDHLKVYYDFFESNPAIGAAGGRIVAKYTTPPPSWMSPFTERAIAGIVNHGAAPRPFPKGKFFGGGNMAIRRSMFDKYGLYNTELGRTGTKLMAGEEKDLYLRLKAGGEQIWYLPDAVVYHITFPDKLTGTYFRKLSLLIGRSEKVRTKNISARAYVKRLVAEVVKWGGALVLALWYMITLRPSKGWYLIVMRWNISRGLLSGAE